MSRLATTFFVWLCFFISMGKSNLTSSDFHNFNHATISATLSLAHLLVSQIKL